MVGADSSTNRTSTTGFEPGNVSGLRQAMKYKATRAGQASRDPAQLRLDSERGASQLVNKDATF